MEKGRITYRFINGERVETPKQEADKVIPLNQDEFEVKGKSREEGTGGDSLYPVKTIRPSAEVIDTQPLNQYTTDFGAWNSPFEAETERIEKMIRDSKRRSGFEPETGYMEGTDTSKEPLRDHRWYIPEEQVRYNKPSFGSWIKITASVAGAVVTGVAFGFFVLSMFSGHEDGDKAKQAANSQQIAAPASQHASADTGKTTNQTAAANAATAAVQIPAKAYSFLQAGVFSNRQSAEALQTDLKKKGFAAAIDGGDKYTVFAGMALTRNDALAISQQLQQTQTEVYIKNIELPALTKIKWNGKQPETVQNCLTQGAELVQQISGLTLPHLSEAKPTPLDANALNSIKSAHQTWSSLHSGMHGNLVEEAKTAHQKMSTALNTAIVSLDEYKKNPSASYLWQAQSAMMQYTLADKELREAIAAQ